MASLQFRQGDVFLAQVDAIPAGATTVRRHGGRVILALGEATGHAHAIAGPGAELLSAGSDRYLRVTAPVVLGHEEHAAITLPPATYRVVIQREYVAPETSARPWDLTPGFRTVRD
jgi:hypothetical protein